MPPDRHPQIGDRWQRKSDGAVTVVRNVLQAKAGLGMDVGRYRNSQIWLVYTNPPHNFSGTIYDFHREFSFVKAGEPEEPLLWCVHCHSWVPRPLSEHRASCPARQPQP